MKFNKKVILEFAHHFFVLIIKWESRVAEDYKPALKLFMRGWQNTDVFILTLQFKDFAWRPPAGPGLCSDLR